MDLLVSIKVFISFFQIFRPQVVGIVRISCGKELTFSSIQLQNPRWGTQKQCFSVLPVCCLNYPLTRLFLIFLLAPHKHVQTKSSINFCRRFIECTQRLQNAWDACTRPCDGIRVNFPKYRINVVSIYIVVKKTHCAIEMPQNRSDLFSAS